MRTNADRFNTLMLIGCVLIYLTVAAAVNDVFGATYYVKTDGNNASDGLSWANAWAHPNKTNGSLNDGDSVIFAAGQYDTCYVRPPIGGAARTVYTCSSSVWAATVLSSAEVLSTNSADWTQFSGEIYSYDNTISPRWCAWMATGDGILIQNRRALMPQTSTTLSEGQFYYNTTTDVLYVYVRGGGNPASHVMEYSQHPVFHFEDAGMDSVVIEGMTLNGGGGQAVVVIASGDGTDNGTPSAGIIQRCIVQNGGSTQQAHNDCLIYAGTSWSSGVESELGTGWRFVNDTLRYCMNPDDIAEHMGAGLDLYTVEDVLCSALVIHDLNGTGINFKNGYSFNFDIDNIVIMDCRIDSVETGLRIGPHSDSVIVCGNILTNCRLRGLDAHSSDGTQHAYNRVKFFNNTLWNAADQSGQSICLSPTTGTTGSGCEVKYNIIFDTTDVENAIGFVHQEASVPLQDPSTESRWVIDSNLYWFAAGTFSCSFAGMDDCSGTDWTAWTGCYGHDSSSENLSWNDGTNPNFTASETPTLTRPGASAEMSRTYAGRTWTIVGALQPEAEAGTYTRARARMR